MSIPVFEKIPELRAALSDRRHVGFVPTMGALHSGHARLIETARSQSDTVVVSIFVNPIQFDRLEDYERYGRTLAADIELCERAGADLIFAPTVDEMYSSSSQTHVDVDRVTDYFCGSSRPGHFRGVTTVVAKLFNIVQPQRAFFGEKDAQQLAAITRMVDDLNLPILIVPVGTVRESDGLALSSRNSRLSPEERRQAAYLYSALNEARDLIEDGETNASVVIAGGLRRLQSPAIRVDYFGIADATTMQPVDHISGPVRVMGAVWVGATRLIDNLPWFPPLSAPPSIA